jgi:hypothetical protein
MLAARGLPNPVNDLGAYPTQIDGTSDDEHDETSLGVRTATTACSRVLHDDSRDARGVADCDRMRPPSRGGLQRMHAPRHTHVLPVRTSSMAPDAVRERGNGPRSS